jgi:hypothetical protein
VPYRDRITVGANDLGALLDQPLHRLRRLGRDGVEPDVSEHLLEPVDMRPRLLEVRLERVAEIVGVRSRGHLRQRFDELLLCAVQIGEHVDKHIRQRVEFHG